jgi:sugar lactone lactonase YvrE
MRPFLAAAVVTMVLGGMAPVTEAAADPPPEVRARGRAATPTIGEVQTLRNYNPDAGELPEGLAVDKRGRIYVSMTFTGELRRIDPDGSEHVVAVLPTGDFGPAGLAVDAPGNVYAAVITFDPATHGVWRVTPDGSANRLPGSEAVGFPNGVAFGDRGTLYVTDSINGAVWAIPKGGSAELWLQHDVLAGDGSGPTPFPVGANGITYRHRTVYVTNTERGSVVTIPVEPDGRPGEPSILVQAAALAASDGMALDVHGNIYVAVIGQSTIVRISPGGGPITVIADGSDGLDFASSVAFGTGRSQRTTLYAVNFSVGPLFGGAPRTHGPALLAVDVGVPGLPQP